MQGLKRWPSLVRPSQRLTIEAAFWLVLAFAVVRILPFCRIGAWLGQVSKPTAKGGPLGEGNAIVARQVGQAIQRAVYRLSFEAVCLPQAIAARAMLNRRGIDSVVHFGVAPRVASDAIRAHAWVTAGPVGVIGIAGASGLEPLADFSRSAGAPVSPQ